MYFFDTLRSAAFCSRPFALSQSYARIKILEVAFSKTGGIIAEEKGSVAVKKAMQLNYKWVILCACFLMCFVTLGFCSGNKSLFLSAITEALGIKRSLFSISDSCRYIATALINLFFAGFILQGLSGTNAAHMKDTGLDAGFVATVLSIGSLALTGTKLLVGFLYDWKGLRFTTAICHSAAVIAMVAMAMLNASASGKILAFGFILLYSLALPLETLVIPLIANDIFGLASYDRALGILLCMNYSGYALGAPLFNLCFDHFGSYTPMLWLCCGIMAAVGVLFQLALRSAGKEKQQLLNEAKTQ